jgi:hypothetical protein
MHIVTHAASGDLYVVHLRNESCLFFMQSADDAQPNGFFAHDPGTFEVWIPT